MMSMAQLNLNLTQGFLDQLQAFMTLRRIKTKSEAIRVAVEEALRYSSGRQDTFDFSAIKGAGKAFPRNKKPRFVSHDQLWS